MNTQKPISTISWNSEPFLIDLLTRLLKAHKIDHWEMIHHIGEDDEAGKKDHFHVYLEPSKRIQTADLKDQFLEPITPDQKPLGCLAFRSSVYSDWYLYALHDPAYLAAHFQSRRYHYSDEQIKTADPDEHCFRVRSVDMSQYAPIKKLKAFKDAGLTFSDAVSKGVVPIPQLSQYERAWSLLKNETDRGGRPGHDPDPQISPTSPEEFPQYIVDPETGETTLEAIQ